PSNPAPILAGRASGPRWIQVLSTSIEPPPSPVRDHLRPAARAEKLLPHVTMLTVWSLRNGSTTSIRTDRTTQRCSGAPQPVSSTSSIAASCRNLATASSRRRPVASASESRTLYVVRKVRPVAGIGTSGSTCGTLRQVEHHPPVRIAGVEVDIAQAHVQPFCRV